MVRTIAVRGGPFFYFVLVLFECARVESQPEAPLESIRNGWMLLFFVLIGQPCKADCLEDLCEDHGRNRELMQPLVYSLSYVLFVYMCGFE